MLERWMQDTDKIELASNFAYIQIWVAEMKQSCPQVEPIMS